MSHFYLCLASRFLAISSRVKPFSFKRTKRWKIKSEDSLIKSVSVSANAAITVSTPSSPTFCAILFRPFC